MTHTNTTSDERDSFESTAEIISAFYKHCLWARGVKTHYETLFQSGDLRLQLINETAGAFFHDLKWIMGEYLVLQQCKLTDPSSSGKNKDNLTTSYVLSLDWTSETRSKLEQENSVLQNLRGKILPLRNQMISHLDRKSGITLGSFKILNAEEDRAFWEHLQRFLTFAFEEALPGESSEIDLPMPDGDAGSLLYKLADAIDYDVVVETQPGFLTSRRGKRRYEGI
jgi:hypothetical protein